MLIKAEFTAAGYKYLKNNIFGGAHYQLKENFLPQTNT